MENKKMGNHMEQKRKVRVKLGRRQRKQWGKKRI